LILPTKPIKRVPLAARPPKKPAGPYFIFVARTRPADAKSIDDYLNASKTAAGIWRNMTDAEKQPYQDEYKVLYREYERQRAKWHNDPKNTPVLRLLNQDRKKRGKHMIHLPKGLGPKRPLNPFMRFVADLKNSGTLSQDQQPSNDAQNYVVWAAREAGSKWRALPEAEKARYRNVYAAEKEAMEA